MGSDTEAVPRTESAHLSGIAPSQEPTLDDDQVTNTENPTPTGRPKGWRFWVCRSRDARWHRVDFAPTAYLRCDDGFHILERHRPGERRVPQSGLHGRARPDTACSQTSVSTALPTIVDDLNGEDFVWVGSAYALGSTAILPMTGGLAQIFGRRPVVLGSLAFFAVGSALSGAAQSMAMLIAGRSTHSGPCCDQAEIDIHRSHSSSRNRRWRHSFPH